MPHKELQKNRQVQNPQPGMQVDMQQGQRMQQVQMPPMEDALAAKRRGRNNA